MILGKSTGCSNLNVTGQRGETRKLREGAKPGAPNPGGRNPEFGWGAKPGGAKPGGGKTRRGETRLLRSWYT